MADRRKMFIILAVVVAALSVLAYKDRSSGTCAVPVPGMIDEASSGDTAVSPEDATSEQLPRFVEVGADSCVPCKMMQPVLDELRSDYAGKLQIEFADIWKTPELGEKYGVRSIPTQIIYDSSGKEVFRHLGFWPKEEIDAKLRELGLVE
jgi:thioredoxin 1